MTVDHVAIALSRLAHQFKGKTKLIGLLTALTQPSSELATALNDLLTKRGIDTAISAQLDDIGLVVGQPRNGVTDDELYRRYVRARIMTNRSQGRVEDVLRIADLVVYDDDALLRLKALGNASFHLMVDGVTLDADVAAILLQFLQDGVSAGVRPLLEYSTNPSHLDFKFAGGRPSTTRASLSLLDASGNIDTVVEAVTPGASGNSMGVIVISAGGPASLVEFPDYDLILIQTGVTTIGDVERLIRQSSTRLRIKTLSATPATVATSDVEAIVQLAGGVTGGGLGFPHIAERDLNSDGLTVNVDTVLRARVAGSTTQTISFVADGAGAGTLDDGAAAVFHYQSGVTTVANFETAIAASAFLYVHTAGTGANILTGSDDDDNPIKLAGGSPGGRLVSARG